MPDKEAKNGTTKRTGKRIQSHSTFTFGVGPKLKNGSGVSSCSTAPVRPTSYSSDPTQITFARCRSEINPRPTPSSTSSNYPIIQKILSNCQEIATPTHFFTRSSPASSPSSSPTSSPTSSPSSSPTLSSPPPPPSPPQYQQQIDQIMASLRELKNHINDITPETTTTSPRNISPVANNNPSSPGRGKGDDFVVFLFKEFEGGVLNLVEKRRLGGDNENLNLNDLYQKVKNSSQELGCVLEGLERDKKEGGEKIVEGKKKKKRRSMFSPGRLSSTPLVSPPLSGSGLSSAHSLPIGTDFKKRRGTNSPKISPPRKSTSLDISLPMSSSNTEPAELPSSSDDSPFRPAQFFKLADSVEQHIQTLLSSPPNLDSPPSSILQELQKFFHYFCKSVVAQSPDHCFAVDSATSHFEEFLLTVIGYHNEEGGREGLVRWGGVVSRDVRLLRACVGNRRKALCLSKGRGGGGEEGEGGKELAEFLARFQVKNEERRGAVQEIVTTEESYLAQLTEFQTLFIEPLQLSSQNENEEDRLISPKEFSDVFGMNTIIIEGSQEFLVDLKGAVKGDRAQRVGEVFMRLCPWLKHYAMYVNRYEDSMRMIQGAKKRGGGALGKFFRSAEKKSTCSYDFSSYRILPVQRLGRYELLIKRLLELTPKCHPDFEPLETALQKVTEINLQINTFKRQEENRQKVQKISARFLTPPKPPLDELRMVVGEGGLCLLSSRSKVSTRSSMYLSSSSMAAFPSFGEGKEGKKDGKEGKKEGKEGKRDGKGEGKEKRGYYVLFEDALMICRVKEEKLEKKCWIDLKEGLVVDIGEGGRSVKVEASKGHFVSLVFEKERQRSMWLKDLGGVTNVKEREKKG